MIQYSAVMLMSLWSLWNWNIRWISGVYF